MREKSHVKQICRNSSTVERFYGSFSRTFHVKSQFIHAGHEQSSINSMGNSITSFALSYSNLVQPFIVSRQTDSNSLDVRNYKTVFKRSIDDVTSEIQKG